MGDMKLFFSKTNTISAYVLFVSVITFITVILSSTTFWMKDPCYGAGCSENAYLIPMLGSFFLGCISFGIMILSGIIQKVKKLEKWNPPFGIGAVKITISTAVIIALFVVYSFGSLRSNVVQFGRGWTGDDLFNAVNQHRLTSGIPTLTLSPQLCDNLVSRWQKVKEGKQHEGFEEWVKNEGIQTNYGYDSLVELYIQAATSADAIAFWVGSPGHKVQLENPEWKDGCAYANEGYGVVIMGTKKSK